MTKALLYFKALYYTGKKSYARIVEGMAADDTTTANVAKPILSQVLSKLKQVKNVFRNKLKRTKNFIIP